MTYLAVSEIGSSAEGKMPLKSQGVGKNQLSESSQPSSTLTQPGSSDSRPSSNYSTRSQQITGTQKGKNVNVFLIVCFLVLVGFLQRHL